MDRIASSRARVEMTIEFELNGGSWGSDCKIDQVFNQATSDALHTIRKKMEGISIRIIGEPKITAIMVENKR
uniref:Uncharacterized protein n=1 Tax=viral metagenome TaxID=1070528 RepID=A0A6H1ZY58_9ZZZZ